MALLSHLSFQGTLNGTPVPKLLFGHVRVFLILCLFRVRKINSSERRGRGR